MSPKKVNSGSPAVKTEDTAELTEALGKGYEHLHERCVHYLSMKARAVMLRRRRQRHQRSKQASNPMKEKTGSSEETKNPSPNETKPSGKRFRASADDNELVGAFLYDDCCPEDAGPGTALLDDQGTLTLSRSVAGTLLCLEVSFIEKVNPIWNVPLRDVVSIRSWLNRQFRTLQHISTMPKINPRATTKIDHVWDFLAQFETNTASQAVIVRAVPLQLNSGIIVVRAKVISHVSSTQAMIQVPRSSTVLSENRMVAHTTARGQQAEVSRLRRSLTACVRDLNNANMTICDFQHHRRKIQASQAENTSPKKSALVTVLRGANGGLDIDLMAIAPDSIQQASDLSEEIRIAAAKLVNVTETHAIIRPGVTKRTLVDLQTIVDIIEGAAQDIKHEELPLLEDGDDEMSTDELLDAGDNVGDSFEDQDTDVGKDVKMAQAGQ